MPLSPAKAAEIAGVSRSLISKEVKSGNLVGTKNNRGHISILDDDLEDWMNRRTERSTQQPTETAEAATINEDAVRIASLEVEVREIRTQLDDVKRDRDDWKKQAQDLSQARRGIIQRIFG
jgi:hypothetical protein